MSEPTTALNQIDQDVLAYEVSDESLESAASTGNERMGNYTLGSCTGFYSCPA
jgi:hypothetical protein